MSTNNIHFQDKIEISNYPKYINIISAVMEKLLGLKNEFVTALVYDPLVFEPSKFQCIKQFKKEIFY